MRQLQVAGKVVDLDDDGFMTDPRAWDEEVAAYLARLEGIDALGELHWKVIKYLRDYYLRFGVAPMLRKLCAETDLPLKRIYDLFPGGPAVGACKLAGIPKPTGCV